MKYKNIDDFYSSEDFIILQTMAAEYNMTLKRFCKTVALGNNLNIYFRVTEIEKDVLRKIAKKNGVTLSTWCISSVKRFANEKNNFKTHFFEVNDTDNLTHRIGISVDSLETKNWLKSVADEAEISVSKLLRYCSLFYDKSSSPGSSAKAKP